jgi:hypothetical protein
MDNIVAAVAELGQTPGQRVGDVGRIAIIVLGIVLGILAFAAISYALLKGFALLVEMVWPIVTAVVVGLILLLLGYIFASQLLAGVGGTLLGTMFFLYLLGAMTGVEPRDKYSRESDRVERAAMSAARAARRKERKDSRGYRPPTPNSRRTPLRTVITPPPPPAMSSQRYEDAVMDATLWEVKKSLAREETSKVEEGGTDRKGEYDGP